MRVLFFLEPVIFRNDPAFLTCHFVWASYFKHLVQAAQGVYALAANFAVCNAWRNLCQGEPGSLQLYPLKSFKVLQDFQYSKSEYLRALYGSGNLRNSLTDELSMVCATFRPDVVIMTSQNALARNAFNGVPILSIEQAPLPRMGQSFRTMFDPVGHQIGSLLETHASEIATLPFTDTQYDQLRQLLNDIKLNFAHMDLPVLEAQRAIYKLQSEGRVALLVTQPPDWVTYEGAYETIGLEALLYSWAQQLPVGWIGVPTYHPAFKLSREMEAELAQNSSRLRFLPQELSQGFTEALLLQADGMVTISSTSAMTGLLFQKKVIVCGLSPFNAWCLRDVGRLEDVVPWTINEAASTLGFLTHRYSELHTLKPVQIESVCTKLHIMMSHANPSAWFMDISNWSIHRARSLFKFVAI